MQSHLDTQRLAALVRNKRGSKGLREISDEIGNVSPSTLSRIENASVIPDMETFIALCNWLEVHPGELFVSVHQTLEMNTEDEIVLLVLGDKRLKLSTAYALAQIVKATYRYLLG